MSPSTTDATTDATTVAVCWDVDGTLLHGGLVGSEIMYRVFADLAGVAPPGRVDFAGRTDWLIAEAFLDALAAEGRDREALERLRAGGGEEYARAFVAAVSADWPRHDADLAAVATALPGVPGALDALAAEPGVVQVLVTGNVRSGAAAKLAAVGLADSFDLDLGAFGDRPGPRSGLVHAARATLASHHPGPLTLVVVGDTPRDVEAAHAAGAVAVAVATGTTSAADLRAAGADLVLDDLSDPAPLVAAARAAREDPTSTSRGSV